MTYILFFPPYLFLSLFSIQSFALYFFCVATLP
jgi:hypothetical protein